MDAVLRLDIGVSTFGVQQSPYQGSMSFDFTGLFGILGPWAHDYARQAGEDVGRLRQTDEDALS